MTKEIAQLIENLKTQDSRMTNLPIFFVQVKNRVWGVEELASTGYVWVDEDWEEVEDEKLIQNLEEGNPDYHQIYESYNQSYYRDEWINKQPFFTEAAAKEYIRINGHNLCEPRIYVESGYRNAEWELIRQYFLNLTQ